MSNTFSEDGYDFCPFGHPEVPGVYVICIAENTHGQNYSFDPVYVGSSKNIHKRVMVTSHIYRRLYNQYYATHLVAVAVKVTDNYIREEIRMIQKYSPKFNKQHKQISL